MPQSIFVDARLKACKSINLRVLFSQELEDLEPREGIEFGVCLCQVGDHVGLLGDISSFNLVYDQL